MNVEPEKRLALPGTVMFTQPPPDLGPVQAAWTNVKESSYYGTDRRRWIITGILWIGLAILVEVFLNRVISVPSERLVFRLIFHPFVIGYVLLVSLFLRHRGLAKFVCEKGIAQYKLVGTFPGKITEQVFRFSQRGLTPQLNVTKYRGVLIPLKGDWSLAWVEPKTGAVMFELSGTFSRWRQEPDPSDPEFALALAARKAYLQWDNSGNSAGINAVAPKPTGHNNKQ